jgi:hypothetical protein
MSPLNCDPKLAALPKSLVALIRCRSRFRHLARLFLNQIWKKTFLFDGSYLNSFAAHFK